MVVDRLLLARALARVCVRCVDAASSKQRKWTHRTKARRKSPYKNIEYIGMIAITKAASSAAAAVRTLNKKKVGKIR